MAAKFPLFDASCRGDAEAVRELLDSQDGDKNGATQEGITPLVAATEGNHVGVVQVLLDRRVNVDKQVPDGATPLLVAAQRGHVRAAELLCSAGANLDMAKKDGTTPLVMACRRGHVDVVRLLCDAGADDSPKCCEPGLYAAAFGGHTAVVEYLCQAGTDINKGLPGVTPLMAAQEEGHADTQDVLIAHGAEVESQPVQMTTAAWLALLASVVIIGIIMMLQHNERQLLDALHIEHEDHRGSEL